MQQRKEFDVLRSRIKQYFTKKLFRARPPLEGLIHQSVHATAETSSRVLDHSRRVRKFRAICEASDTYFIEYARSAAALNGQSAGGDSTPPSCVSHENGVFFFFIAVTRPRRSSLQYRSARCLRFGGQGIIFLAYLLERSLGAESAAYCLFPSPDVKR